MGVHAGLDGPFVSQRQEWPVSPALLDVLYYRRGFGRTHDGQPLSIHSASSTLFHRTLRPIFNGAGIFPASDNRYTVRHEQRRTPATPLTSISSGGVVCPAVAFLAPGAVIDFCRNTAISSFPRLSWEIDPVSTTGGKLALSQGIAKAINRF